MAEVVTAMGFDGFGWAGNAGVFREWARLTAYENNSSFLNLSGLSAVTPEAYGDLLPIQWPVKADGQGTPRLFVDGCFQTPDRRARMVPVKPRGPAEAVDAAYPMSLNTGPIRDHWHTMTRTGLAPDLCRHAPEPFVEIHPDDAKAQGLKENALVRAVRAVESAGALLYDALVSDEAIALAPPGCVRIQTGKRAGKPSMKQDEINRLILLLARKGLKVVRLNG